MQSASVLEAGVKAGDRDGLMAAGREWAAAAFPCLSLPFALRPADHFVVSAAR